MHRYNSSQSCRNRNNWSNTKKAYTGTTPVNAETRTATATKNEKACTGTTPVNHAETGTTGATRNEKAVTGTTPVDAETGTTAATRNQKATVTGKTPRAEAGTMTATWAAKRIENAKSRTKKTARIIAGTKEKNTPGTGKAGSCDITDEKYNEIVYKTTGTGKTRSCDMTDDKYNEVVYIIENWDYPEIQRKHRIGYSLVKKYTVRSKKDVEGNLIKSLYVRYQEERQCERRR